MAMLDAQNVFYSATWAAACVLVGEVQKTDAKRASILRSQLCGAINSAADLVIGIINNTNDAQTPCIAPVDRTPQQSEQPATTRPALVGRTDAAHSVAPSHADTPASQCESVVPATERRAPSPKPAAPTAETCTARATRMAEDKARELFQNALAAVPREPITMPKSQDTTDPFVHRQWRAVAGKLRADVELLKLRMKHLRPPSGNWTEQGRKPAHEEARRQLLDQYTRLDKPERESHLETAVKVLEKTGSTRAQSRPAEPAAASTAGTTAAPRTKSAAPKDNDLDRAEKVYGALKLANPGAIGRVKSPTARAATRKSFISKLTDDATKLKTAVAAHETDRHVSGYLRKKLKRCEERIKHLRKHGATEPAATAGSTPSAPAPVVDPPAPAAGAVTAAGAPAAAPAAGPPAEQLAAPTAAPHTPAAASPSPAPVPAPAPALAAAAAVGTPAPSGGGATEEPDDESGHSSSDSSSSDSSSDSSDSESDDDAPATKAKVAKPPARGGNGSKSDTTSGRRLRSHSKLTPPSDN
jgi:hypothetical protein